MPRPAAASCRVKSPGARAEPESGTAGSQAQAQRPELERLDKLKTYLPDAPPIRELDESIAAIKALIARQKDTVQRSENRAPNDLVNLLERGKLERGMRAGELKAKVAAYDKAIAALKDERARILGVEPELSRLERNLAVAERTTCSTATAWKRRA